MNVDYDNLTVEQVIKHVEIIDWFRVPKKILFTKTVMEFVEDFPDLKYMYFTTEGKKDIKLKKLLKEGIDINWNNSFFLRNSILNKNLKEVKFLLKKGINVNLKNEKIGLKNSTYIFCGWPLVFACGHGLYEIVKLLLEHGSNVNDGYLTPINVAKANNHKEILNLLKEYGAREN